MNECQNRGRKGKFSCLCPFRRAAGSVDSLIGQIRVIFRDHGRGTDWNGTLGIGNPAGAHIVKKYLEAVKLEQSLAAITPKHAVPLFVDKLIKVSRLIDYNLYNPKLSVYQKYIYIRDKAFFNLLSFTGDQSSAEDLQHEIEKLNIEISKLQNECSESPTSIAHSTPLGNIKEDRQNSISLDFGFATRRMSETMIPNYRYSVEVRDDKVNQSAGYTYRGKTKSKVCS